MDRSNVSTVCADLVRGAHAYDQQSGVNSHIELASRIEKSCGSIMLLDYNFTKTEAIVVSYLKEGFAPTEIAGVLFKSRKTIQFHVDNCRKKTKTKTLYALAVILSCSSP